VTLILFGSAGFGFASFGLQAGVERHTNGEQEKEVF